MSKVLIVGGEGRAHALGWKLVKSPLVEKVYFAPGNGGTEQVGENISIDVNQLKKLVDFAKGEQVDLTVVSPEQPLVDGIVDLFETHGLKIFGPNKTAAQIEGSKAFAADFVLRHNIPHPASIAINSLPEALRYIKDRSPKSYVIKADGLAAGKGVVVPETKAEAETALVDIMKKNIFGAAGRRVVFQERLHGQEVSAFALTDGKNIVMLPFFQDHKRIFEGDKGPNTGGIGAYSPLPFITDELAKRIEREIMQAAIDGMRADGKTYKGALYGGLFITEQGDPKVIEFNCRFGDPENEPLMCLIEDDLYPILLECAQGRLKTKHLKFRPGAVANIVLTSGGYPGDYETGYEIQGLDKISDPDVMVFHAGTKKEANKILTNGGRVLNVTSYGKNLKEALSKAYAQIGPNCVHFKDMYYRTDIGHRVLQGKPTTQ